MTLAPCVVTGRRLPGRVVSFLLLLGVLCVTAFPALSATLTLNAIGQGTIKVDGTERTLPWSSDFDLGQNVTLEAVPASGQNFCGWEGDANGYTNPITITMDSDKSISACFTPIVYNLNVTAAPETGGWFGNGAGHSLGNFTYLCAWAAPGWRFAGWSGDINSETNPLSFVRHSDTTVVGHFSPVAQTAVFYRQTFQDDRKVRFSEWHYTGNWAVIPDVSTKPGILTDPSPDGPAGLVYDPHGDYPPNIDDTVTTTAIDCSHYTSVALTFLRSLTVQDAAFDQATVEVSNDGTTWTTVYENPTGCQQSDFIEYADLFSPAWFQVSYDISRIADGQKTVYLRFRLASSGSDDGDGAYFAFHGWALDDITLSGAGPDPAYTFSPVGVVLPSGLASYGPLPSLPSPLWQIGPAVTGGGQTRDADGDPTTPGTATVGVDPGTNAAGEEGGTILGTAIGGNYSAGMSGPEYLQWGPLNLTGLQQTALQFQRWLQVGAGRYDRATIQVHVATPHPAGDTIGAMAPELIAESTSVVTLTPASPKTVYPVSTGEHYAPLGVSFTYHTQDLAADGSEVLRFQYTLDDSVSAPAWITFAGGTVSTNAPNSSDAQTLTFGLADFASQADSIHAQDDAAFAVRAILSERDGTALSASSPARATISDMQVTGVLWNYVWDNQQVSPTTETFDQGWTPVSYDLSRFGADNCPNVWVRWSLGPTDSGFDTEYGGWSLDDLQILSASNRWAADAITAPAALTWGQTGEVTVTARNAGTARWDSTYHLYEVEGEDVPVSMNPGNCPWDAVYGLSSSTARSDTRRSLSAATAGTPMALLLYDPWGNGMISGMSADPGDPLSQPISRWEVGPLAVDGPVAPGATTTFRATITAPPLSTITFPPLTAWPNQADPYDDALRCDWALATKTARCDVDFLPTLLHTAIASAPVITSRFPDDALNPDGTRFWARKAIEELAGRVPAVIQGYQDGTYRPSLTVTRDQMAVYIARIRGLTPTGVATEDFTDVPTDFWAYPQIEACAWAGIVSGYPDRSYRPADPVTRDEMAKFICLAAGFTIIPAPAPGSSWFTDVENALPYGWKPGDPDPRNIYRDYINTLWVNKIVYGYPEVAPDGTVTFTYRPSQPVTRDQLAVFLWRAFLEKSPSVVVLGGPAITPVPLVTGKAPYYGYANAGAPFLDGPFAGGITPYPSLMTEGTDRNYAYITLDAERLTGSTRPLAVTFKLRPVTGSGDAVTATENVPLQTIDAWTSEVNAPPYGPVYRNVAWALPTGLQGDYRLVVTINGNTLSRQPYISMQAPLYAPETFDDADWLTSHGWQTSGQPALPGPLIYPLSYSTDEVPLAQRWAERGVLYNGDGSLELSETQAVVKAFSTAGHHNLRLALRFAAPAASFGNSDTVTIAWSPDYATLGSSAQWNTLATLTRADIPTALQKDLVVYDLPNGDPNADPVVIGADDNENFAIRISVNGSASTKAYFDDLVLEGT